jgi:steroid 5-alpha reductase family enzyme
MNAGALFLSGWLVVALVMICLWFLQRKTRIAGIVDVAWSFGTGLLGAYFAWGAVDGDVTRRLIVALMAAVWGARLGIFLIRRLTAEKEDGRYLKLRSEWGESFQFKMLLFFQVQALWAVMFAAPMFAAASNPIPAVRWFDFAGVFVWIVSMTGESIADRQLARFRTDPVNRGKVCATGLWRYSRHPNYFFESLHWWAYLFMALGSPYWWVALCGPFLMLLFILKITGIPPTERRALETRGEAYRHYQRTTSVLLPWPPKK